MAALYHRLLGDACPLPPVIQWMHDASPRVVAVRVGSVTRGTNPVSHGLARLSDMQAGGTDRPLRVMFEAGADGETLSCRYPDAMFSTPPRAPGSPAGGLPIGAAAEIPAGKAGVISRAKLTASAGFRIGGPARRRPIR